jgi:hypothetical protein
MQRDAVTRVCTYPIDAFDLNASRLDWTDRWIRPVVTTDTSHEGKKGIHFLRCLPWSTLLQRRFPPRHLLPSASQSGGEIFCFVRDRSSLNKQTGGGPVTEAVSLIITCRGIHRLLRLGTALRHVWGWG